MQLREMTDYDLTERIISYITRCEELGANISEFLEESKSDMAKEIAIREEYKALKQAIQDDAHQLSLRGNDKGSDLFLGFFAPSIKEASAYGFRVATNHRIDGLMHSSVAEARYRSTKYKTLKRWKESLENMM